MAHTDIYNGAIIEAFAIALFRGDDILESIPGLLKRIITEDLWQDYLCGGVATHYDTFVEFLKKGVNAELRTVQHLCRDDNEALSLLDQEVRNSVGYIMLCIICKAWQMLQQEHPHPLKAIGKQAEAGRG